MVLSNPSWPPHIDVLGPRMGPKIRGPLNELQAILASFGGPLILGPYPLEGYPRVRKFQISDTKPKLNKRISVAFIFNMVNL